MEGYGNENPGAFQPTRPLRGATSFIVTTPQTTEFQPTRPLRGATHPHSARSHLHRHFNPRAPCGARPEAQHDGRVGMAFQPTRPLRGATITLPQAPSRMTFQPTRPLRGATCRSGGARQMCCYFNPRAPCGARPCSLRLKQFQRNFNPRAPCGARLLFPILCRKEPFQPTRPLRGATFHFHV